MAYSLREITDDDRNERPEDDASTQEAPEQDAGRPGQGRLHVRSVDAPARALLRPLQAVVPLHPLPPRQALARVESERAPLDARAERPEVAHAAGHEPRVRRLSLRDRQAHEAAAGVRRRAAAHRRLRRPRGRAPRRVAPAAALARARDAQAPREGRGLAPRHRQRLRARVLGRRSGEARAAHVPVQHPETGEESTSRPTRTATRRGSAAPTASGCYDLDAEPT
jgi:hypothetical protein